MWKVSKINILRKFFHRERLQEVESLAARQSRQDSNVTRNTATMSVINVLPKSNALTRIEEENHDTRGH